MEHLVRSEIFAVECIYQKLVDGDFTVDVFINEIKDGKVWYRCTVNFCFDDDNIQFFEYQHSMFDIYSREIDGDLIITVDITFIRESELIESLQAFRTFVQEIACNAKIEQLKKLAQETLQN